MHVILLPGLDGTGHLFAYLLKTLPSGVECSVVSYPTDLKVDYYDLQSYVLRYLPETAPFTLVAESFSGPLALKIAASRPRNLVAIVLCATFVQIPLPRLFSLFRFLIQPSLFRLWPLRFFIRRLLLTKDAPEILISKLFDTLRLVEPEILAYRMRSVFRVNAKQELLVCPVPILYLFATQDKLVAKRHLRQIISLRPDVRSTSIKAPHLLLQCAPELASKAIVDFLRQL